MNKGVANYKLVEYIDATVNQRSNSMQTENVIININGIEVDAVVRFHYEPPRLNGFGCHPDNAMEIIDESFDLQDLFIGGDQCNVLLDYVENDIVEQLMRYKK